MRIVGLSLAVGFLFLTLAPALMAGERPARVWEGITIGLGTGFAMSAFFHPAVVYYQPAPPPVA